MEKSPRIFRQPFVLAVHGGANYYSSEQLSPTIKKGRQKGLLQALEAGYGLLKKGKSSLDAVQAAVVVLENNEFFNAGRGAVLTRDGTVELDASIMSSDSRAGAAASVKRTKNPILLARQIMEETSHVLLIERKADEFAAQQGLEQVSNDYFIVKRCLQAWKKAANNEIKESALLELGTVGAVALDLKGCLAAATSSGGINYKMNGRVGDSALIGAGTYANPYCAVSCTGRGEIFIRRSIASFVCLLVSLGFSLEVAAFKAIFEEVESIGGKGGLIAIDCLGNCVMPFNTPSMSRGYWLAGEDPVIDLD